MENSLFQGLPPPSCDQTDFCFSSPRSLKLEEPPSLVVAPRSILKSAIKRSQPAETTPCLEGAKTDDDIKIQKRLRFKTETDASELQLIEAMQKIALHVKNPLKFSKASKLAIQLVQAGSVKPKTSEHFFAILDAAMSSTICCTDPSVRENYYDLFSAVQDVVDCFNQKQKHQLASWTIRAILANELFTDDSFVFSKASGKIKNHISNLPVLTDDAPTADTGNLDTYPCAMEEEQIRNKNSDPFGLDALISSPAMGADELGENQLSALKIEAKEIKFFFESQRAALFDCLEIAARRYRTPWCQTTIDILVKHAFDNVAKFESWQRGAIEKLWVSIREQQNRRKHGKSVNGKLDVTAFEWLQQKYATEKISIRHAVGGSGDRRAEQWLG